MAKSVEMTEGRTLPQIFYFALPLLMGNLLQQTYSFVVVVFVGNFLVFGHQSVSRGWRQYFDRFLDFGIL